MEQEYDKWENNVRYMGLPTQVNWMFPHRLGKFSKKLIFFVIRENSVFQLHIIIVNIRKVAKSKDLATIFLSKGGKHNERFMKVKKCWENLVLIYKT